MRRFCAALVAVLALAACTAAPHQPAPQKPAPPKSAAPGWTQVFRDDFDGPAGSPPATANWQYDIGTCYPGCPAPNWGTGEIESTTDATANVSLDGGGHLAVTPVNAGGSWTSGRIETRRADFAAPANGTLRVEASIRQPAVTTADGAGYWPAFWMLGAPIRDGSGQWPNAGEIDVMEAVNGRPSAFGTLHCGALPDGPCHETTGGLTSGEHPCAGCADGFHTYAVELDRTQVRWYLDGAPYFTAPADRVDAATWERATAHGFFLIVDVAVGGALPKAFGGGPNAGTVSGRPMLLDHVAVYTRPAT